MTIPFNVIPVIYSKADGRTKARLQTLSMATRAHPHMQDGVPRTGYLYGTGRHQKLYNQLPRRLATLRSLYFHTRNNRAHTQVYFLANELHHAMNVYKRSIRAGNTHVSDGTPREDIMDEVLVSVNQRMEAVLAQHPEVTGVTNKERSHALQQQRRLTKAERTLDYHYARPEPATLEARRADRVARRAARRL